MSKNFELMHEAGIRLEIPPEDRRTDAHASVYGYGQGDQRSKRNHNSI